MKSNLRIDNIIRSCIQQEFEGTWLKSIVESIDCQDTDDDNSTECYFYISKDNHKVLEKVKRQIANILGVDHESAVVEDQSAEGNPQFRIEFIVEICDGNGRKFH